MIKFGDLHMSCERVLIREAMEHRGHPPAKPLNPPDARKTNCGICVQFVSPAGTIVLDETGCQAFDIGDGQIHTLCSSRGHNMGSISGEEQ